MNTLILSSKFAGALFVQNDFLLHFSFSIETGDIAEFYSLVFTVQLHIATRCQPSPAYWMAV